MSICVNHFGNKILETVFQKPLFFSRGNSPDEPTNDVSWSAIIWSRLTRILRTHAFKVDIDHMFSTESATNNTSEPDPDSNIVQGELQRKFADSSIKKSLLALLMLNPRDTILYANCKTDGVLSC